MKQSLNFRYVALIFAVCLPSMGQAGISDKGGGRTPEIKAKLVAKHHDHLVKQLKDVFSNQPAAAMSLRSYVANFINNKAQYVSNAQTRAALKDMKERGAAKLILDTVKFLPSEKCVDQRGNISSAVAPITKMPPAKPEVCVDIEKIVADEGPDIKDSVLIGITLHELSHFYGYEDLTHDLAADISEFIASVYSVEDNSLVKLPQVEVNQPQPQPDLATTNCAIQVEKGLTGSACNPLDYINSTGAKDIYTKSSFTFASREIRFEPIHLTNGGYSRRALRILSSIDVPASTGDKINSLRSEIAKVTKIENPKDGVIGTIHVEVYPDQPTIDFYGHTWENQRTGQIYDQAKYLKFYELKTQFENGLNQIKVADLMENTAYKIEITIVGKDSMHKVLTSSQYFTYFNVKTEFTPPIYFTSMTAPVITDMARKLNSSVREFNELEYRNYLSEGLVLYRELCATEVICDGSVQNRSYPYLTMVDNYLSDLNSNFTQGYKSIRDHFNFSRADYTRRTLTAEWNKSIGSGADLTLEKKKRLLAALLQLLEVAPSIVNNNEEGRNIIDGWKRETLLLRRDIEATTVKK